MNKEHIIRRLLEEVGSTIEFIDNEWTSVPFKAVIRPLWLKKNSLFEKDFTEIGSNINEYFLYIGPVSHDIFSLSDDAIVRSCDKSYEFKHKDIMRFGDEPLYYEGILRLVKEGQYDSD